MLVTTLAFELAGHYLFCVRGGDGQVRSFCMCKHRAHTLVSGSGNAKILVCPYHARSYELSGGLRDGSNIHAVLSFDKSKIYLSQVRVEDFAGFLYVSLDSDAEATET